VKKYNEYLILGLIIAVSIAIRLFFAFYSPSFQNDGSYSVIRQVEEIQATGTPLYNDHLSYSGRYSPFTPGYHYLLTAGIIAFPDKLAFNLIPIILASIAPLIIYLISRRLTNNVSVSLFSSFISIFIPIYIQKTTNTLSSFTMVVPLTLLCLFLFSKVNKNNKKSIAGYVISLCLLSITSGNVFILIGCLLLYVLILKLEEIKLDKVKKELIIFSLFFVFWIQFLIYKKALLVHGPYVIWQNIPLEFIMNYFSDVNLLSVVYYVGIIPFFCGMYILYKYSLKIKNEQVYLYIAMTSVISLLLFFRLIELQLGLVYLGFCFVIFFSLFYKQLLIYIDKTRFNKYKAAIISLIVLLFFFSSILPSVARTYESENIRGETIEALKWIKNSTPTESIILGTVEEGELINTVARRKNIIDRNFMMIEDINARVKDIRLIYTSSSTVKAIELLDFYDINYIIVDDAKEEYNIGDLLYTDSECLELVYDINIKIYEVLCKVEIGER